MASAKFSKFNISTTCFKKVGKHEIKADVLIPKTLSSGTYPVIVRFHGGYMITGSRLFADWFPSWLVEYALLHSAIIVMPDYRLLPESTGADINADVADFWTWVHRDLASFLYSSGSGINVDIEKLLVVGESAGGYLAIQSALSQPSISAAIAAYPMIDLKSDFYSKAFEKPIMGSAMLPASIIDEHITDMSPGQIVSSAEPPARVGLAFAIVQQGRFMDFFGNGPPALFPMEQVEHIQSVPPLFIFHGRDDTAVPVEESESFVATLKTRLPESKVLLVLEPGDHAFDITATVETPWLKQGLEFVTNEWL
ncbi:Alpha/Beta hydrolase protein [Lipomyces tetrasporus]|uniref:Alpha/Beta hydrolase protein n=1 Tax=Lipomyces tetrasporus TaxID=54092 RepID=A0AAD7QUU7_9ASCO|nr:Alpha/Beta hydrolase protein [Lipomyces tetrasporus]KAJ8101952.1 Alpha/Beta hydrolase protein [Lipomyces tetrasporus]